MPQARRNQSGNGSTDTASPAQNRITVQLTADAGAIIDRLSQRMQADMGRTLGFAPDLSRAQVVTAILKAAEANPPRGEAQATAQELAEAPTA